MLVRSPTDIGIFIRDSRKRKNLDQSELAAMIGVNRRWVMEVEKGKPRAEVGLILKALEALGIRIAIDENAGGSTPSTGVDIVDIDAIVRNAKGSGS
jgi:HTH-type transcriptional regulator/antitoxin HipB